MPAPLFFLHARRSAKERQNPACLPWPAARCPQPPERRNADQRGPRPAPAVPRPSPQPAENHPSKTGLASRGHPSASPRSGSARPRATPPRLAARPAPPPDRPARAHIGDTLSLADAPATMALRAAVLALLAAFVQLAASESTYVSPRSAPGARIPITRPQVSYCGTSAPDAARAAPGRRSPAAARSSWSTWRPSTSCTRTRSPTAAAASSSRSRATPPATTPTATGP